MLIIVVMAVVTDITNLTITNHESKIVVVFKSGFLSKHTTLSTAISFTVLFSGHLGYKSPERKKLANPNTFWAEMLVMVYKPMAQNIGSF